VDFDNPYCRTASQYTINPASSYSRNHPGAVN